MRRQLAVGVLLCVVGACGTDALVPPNETPEVTSDSGVDSASPNGADGSVTLTDSGSSDGNVTPTDAGPTEDSSPPIDSGSTLLAKGAACTVDADAGDAGTGNCETGHCVDGVCCDTVCDGTCARCDVTALVGTCAPTPAGVDPDHECLGDGTESNACSGACDGANQCSFPEALCGTAACGGTGGQVSNHKQCINGACAAVSEDCSLKGFCDASKGLCEGAKENGTICVAGNECKSAKCIDAACCATSCTTPGSCSTGACLCNGVACTAGAACIKWYVDLDGDGYGAPASGPTAVSCANVTPPPYNGKNYQPSTKKDDCYDANILAFPGSSHSSESNRGDGKYDYNCDGAETIVWGDAYNVQGKTCTGCATYNQYGSDPCAHACVEFCGNNCQGKWTGLLIAFGCPATCAAGKAYLNQYPSEGWTGATPGCGVTAAWGKCTGSLAPGNCTVGASPTASSKPQLCY